MCLIRVHIAVLALVVTGCEGALCSTADRDDLRFTVAAENVGTALVVKGSVASRRWVTPVKVGYASCFNHNVRVSLYRTPERKPPAVWEDAAGLCRAKLIVAGIAPRGPISPPEMVGEISPHSLRQSLPAGTYYATASIRLGEPNVESGEIVAGTIAGDQR